MTEVEAEHTARLIDLRAAPVCYVLSRLLQDKSTGKNIIFATDAYSELGPQCGDRCQITKELLDSSSAPDIRPRVVKSEEEQARRTRAKAEVFTPSWMVNFMNNYADEQWFGRKDVFNVEQGRSWVTNPDPVEFDGDQDWHAYVDSRRLEITCGEAPYLVSRYDTSTGEVIPVHNRIGMLDRKLRVVSENAGDEETWIKWALRAVEATYGYEFQGDSLLIARINVLMTVADNFDEHLHRPMTKHEAIAAASRIQWNLWQMDGLTGETPLGVPSNQCLQIPLFPVDGTSDEALIERATPCALFDWRTRKKILFNDISRGA